MVLFIDFPLGQAFCLCNLLEIFQLELRPSHHRRYHWGMYSEERKLGDLGMKMVFDIQSTLGFHLHSQGISRMICCHPKLRIMRFVLFLKFENRMLV